MTGRFAVLHELSGPDALADILPSFYVNDATGNDTTGDGSFFNPWKTITKAIATVSIDGNVNIKVATGTYTEGTYLNISRAFAAPVYIQAYNGPVTLQGNGASIASIFVNGNAKNHVFVGMNIVGNGALRTVWFGNNEVGIENISFNTCNIINVEDAGYGVWFFNNGASNCYIIESTVTATGAGAIPISVNGKAAASAYVDNLLLYNNTVVGDIYALCLPAAGWVSNLSVIGGTYTANGNATGAAIGLRTTPLTGPLTNILLRGVTIRGNGRGIELGGTGTITNLNIESCDVDASANIQLGVYLKGVITELTIDGGTFTGGEDGATGGGYGAIGLNGGAAAYNITDVVIQNTTIIVVPEPGGGILGLAVGGIDGFLIAGNTISGDGRAIAVQDYSKNGVIRNNTTTTTDVGVRAGHDAVGAYVVSGINIYANSFTTLDTIGAIIGEGAVSINLYNNVIIGGLGGIRFRGDPTNSDINVYSNDISRNPLGTSTKALIECYGGQNISFYSNTLINGTGALFNMELEAGENLDDCSFINNAVDILGGTIYDIDAGVLGSNVVFDANDYAIGTATFGTILGTVCTDIEDARAAWGAYEAGTNDANSTVIPL